jgi:ribosomal protein S27E
MFTGSYDKCVTAIRERSKDDMAAVTATIFSHAQVKGICMSCTSVYDVACFQNSNIHLFCAGCQEELVGHNAD